MTPTPPPPRWLSRVVDAAGGKGITESAGTNPVLERTSPDGVITRQAAVLVRFGGPGKSDPTSRGGLPADADVLL